MTTPQQMGMMGPDNPISFEMIMRLRNAARGQQTQNPEGMEGAIQRRMENGPPVSQEVNPDEMEPEMPGEIAPGQTPEDVVISDIQQGLEAAIEPPDITQTAATTMMRYGAIQEYLMRAKGELPNA